MKARRSLFAGGFLVALVLSFLAPNPVEAIIFAVVGVLGVYLIVWGVVHGGDVPAPRPEKHRHTFGVWKTARTMPTTGGKGLAVEQERACSECGYIETRTP